MRSSGDQDMSAAEQIPLNLDEARPLAERRDNMASEGLSDDKLNGRVYTPLATAVAMLDRLPWPSEEATAALLDPACGDGVFLEAALRKLARHSPPRRSSAGTSIPTPCAPPASDCAACATS